MEKTGKTAMDTDRIDQIIDKHQGEASSLIQVLLEIQSEHHWLPKEALERVSERLGVPFTQAHGSIRFSLSRYNTPEQVEYVADALPLIVQRLRQITPFNAERATF